jgi:hypothetical protein
MIDTDRHIQTEGEPGQYLERVHLDSYELRKKGALRFDFSIRLGWMRFSMLLRHLAEHDRRRNPDGSFLTRRWRKTDSNSRSFREGKGFGQPLQASIAVSDPNL